MWRDISGTAFVICLPPAKFQRYATEFRRENPNAGFRDLRIHDLRRTLGSWQAATGASLPILGKSLGHKSLAATQIYARLNLDPVRESVNKATDAMLLAAGVAGLLNH
jgi:integrase